MRKKMRKNRKNSQGNFIINLINGKTPRYDVFGENYSSPYFFIWNIYFACSPGWAGFLHTYRPSTYFKSNHVRTCCTTGQTYVVGLYIFCTYVYILAHTYFCTYSNSLGKNVQKCTKITSPIDMYTVPSY